MSIIPRWDHRPPERGEALGHRFYGGYPRRCGDEDRAIYEAKFMLPLSFSEAAAAEKYMAQQHARMAALSIITEGGQMGRDRAVR